MKTTRTEIPSSWQSWDLNQSLCGFEPTRLTFPQGATVLWLWHISLSLSSPSVPSHSVFSIAGVFSIPSPPCMVKAGLCRWPVVWSHFRCKELMCHTQRAALCVARLVLPRPSLEALLFLTGQVTFAVTNPPPCRLLSLRLKELRNQ